MKSILDPTFSYTPSYGTNLAKSFAKIRRRQRVAEKKPSNVLQISASITQPESNKLRSSLGDASALG